VKYYSIYYNKKIFINPFQAEELVIAHGVYDLLTWSEFFGVKFAKKEKKEEANYVCFHQVTQTDVVVWATN